MKEGDVRARAFAMALTRPAYPMGPYRSSIGNSSLSLAGYEPDRIDKSRERLLKIICGPVAVGDASFQSKY